MKRAARGFTLLELLVALAIFALMGAMAFRGLTVILDTRQQVTDSGRKWQDLSRLQVRLQQDLAQVVLRPIRDTRGVEMPNFVGELNPVGEDAALLSFTRMGWAGQSDRSQNLQRVSYRLREQRIELLSWSSLDQAPRERPVVDTLLEGVSSLQVDYLDAAARWQNHWPIAGQFALPPVAVKWTLVLNSGEKIVWQWVVR